MSMFNQPTSSGGFFKPADANGHLILVTAVHEITQRYDDLRKKDMDNATVDLVDLDDGGQELQERVIVSHPALVNRLSVGGGLTLGRIGQIPTQSGFQAWALLPFQEGIDDKRAEAWVHAHRPTFNQAAAPAAPAPAPVPAPAPIPAPAAAAVPPGVNPQTGEITSPPPGLTPQQYQAAQQNPATAALAQQAAHIPAQQQPGDEPPF